MRLHNAPIKRRLMLVILITSIMVLALTSVAFVLYEIIASGQELRRSVEVAGRLVAAQSTSALAFDDPDVAFEILDSLKFAEYIEAAALYQTNLDLFAYYPTNAPAADFSPTPPSENPGFRWDRFVLTETIMWEGKPRGTLWMQSNLAPIYDRLRLYSLLLAIVMAGSGVMAFLLSQKLQERISQPILELATAARAVSERRDYSVRARKISEDELGVLTDAFNHMLGQIQDRETALQESADRLRLALQASQVGTWDWHIRANHINWDEFVYRQFGLQPGETDPTFEGFLKRVCREDRDFVARRVQEAMANHSEFNAEFRVEWPDGSTHYLAVRGKAIYDEHGNPVRMTGVSLDISDRKKAEQARALIAAIVESSDDAIVGKDLNGTILSWNAGAERMFGYTPQEIIGRSVNILTSPDRPNEEESILEKIRSGSPVEHYETVRIHRDGSRIDVALTVSPIHNANGDTVGVSSIARDITSRKHDEQILSHQAAVLREQAQLLDLANVLARDLNGKIILWSAGMEQMYGWMKDEAQGRLSHELLKTEFPQPRDAITATLFEDGEWSGELVQKRRNGEVIIVASRWVLHRDDAGQPAAILEVNNDISERKLAEEEVRRLNADLERRVHERTAELTEANRELEAFTYSVSHDLRAPLRHIDAFARILQEEFSSAGPDLRNYVDRIRKGTQTMGRLVDDLLNLSRVGRAQLGWQTVDLNAVLEEVLADLRPELGERNIDWRIGTLPSAECDPGLIKQVFANLLSNAIKYTRPREQAIIEVDCTVQDNEPVIYVRDNGVGFNIKYAHKLFGVFERLHRAEEFEGTGIGLATVRRIIQKHGGRVWAEAEVDKGAAFYFTLHGLKKPNELLPTSGETLRSHTQPV